MRERARASYGPHAVSHVDELRRYLEAVRDGLVPQVELRPTELRQRQRALLRRFEAAQKAEALARAREQLGQVFARWTEPEFFASLVERLYLVALDHAVERSSCGPLVDELLAWLIAEDEPHLVPQDTTPASMRLRSLRRDAEAAARELLRLRGLGLPPPARHAERLGLVLTSPAAGALPERPTSEVPGQLVRLSASGDLLLRLPARDATRWLVALELARRGASDAWAVDPALLRRLTTTGVEFSHRDHAFARLAERDEMDAELAALGRLTAFGLVSATMSDGEYEQAHGIEVFEATPLGREVFTELLGESPLSVLAHAVVADQTVGTVSDLLRVASPGEATSAATDEALRHMRMFAHEIRNSLVPVQIAFEHLWRDLPAEALAGRVAGLQHTIQLGLARIFQFVEESARVAKLAPAPPEPFAVAPALRDAIGAIQLEFSHEIGLTTQDVDPAVVGHRERFILVVVNLLRNAWQVGGEGTRVELTLAMASDAVEVTVDDDGPGVPVEHQARVFEPGFSLRPDGSGHGLALVREVVEGELGGRITCSSGPRGGARFTVRLPSASRGAS